MKTAKIWAAAVFVACPYCDEPLEAPRGSHMHDGMNRLSHGGRSVYCSACLGRFKLPEDYTILGNRAAMKATS